MKWIDKCLMFGIVTPELGKKSLLPFWSFLFHLLLGSQLNFFAVPLLQFMALLEVKNIYWFCSKMVPFKESWWFSPEEGSWKMNKDAVVDLKIG
ncbi:hypothetical protein PanWU01x14_149370 [Parasponia andersonii]|uniref:Uncharacterized protein n=1 Tax=Parasponia andersonii TaxID=3476 RepID=A0A2P5CIV5_PARAD|nr:hypothetical protein PanWU01x14_149370 [Parasponia andersonii]